MKHRFILRNKPEGARPAMASRLVATQESIAHTDYKQALLDAGENATVFTICLNKMWQNAPHRILRNSTVEMWEAVGCPQPGQCPGEHEVVTHAQDGSPIERYLGAPPVEGMT